MSDRADSPQGRKKKLAALPPKPAHQVDSAKPTTVPELDDLDYDAIPVDELVRLTRELTQRITNEDRQRLALELKESGHQRTIQSRGPIDLQQFFGGEIDLDTELARRFGHAPIMSEVRVQPPGMQRRTSAILASQNGSATVTFDLQPLSGVLEIVFTLSSMLSLRFHLSGIDKIDRQRWLELMRRNNGMAFLWTKARWESDYMIFVVRENFVRLYAFSPQRFEAAARITIDSMENLLDWLEVNWIVEAPSEPIQTISDFNDISPHDKDSSDFSSEIKW